jgi:hypothetical protein
MQEIRRAWLDRVAAFTYPATVEWHGLCPPFAPVLKAGFHRQVLLSRKALNFLLKPTDKKTAICVSDVDKSRTGHERLKNVRSHQDRR